MWWLPTYDYAEKAAADTTYVGQRLSSALDMFGGSSVINGASVSDSTLLDLEYSAHIDPTLSILILSILVAWCYMIFRYGRILSWSAKNLVSVSGALFMFSTTSLDFMRFIRMGSLICILSISAALSSVMTDGKDIIMVFGAAVVALMVVGLWGKLFRKVFSKFDYKPSRWRDIENLGNFDTAMVASVVAAPLMVAMPIPGAGGFVVSLFMVGYIYHFFRIVYYFKSSKFSFLQSFLYLCAIEIVPIALLWGVVTYINVL